MKFEIECIISTIKETFESSSIHALPNIIRNRFTAIKILWIICFLCSSGLCGFFIFQSILDYLNYDIVTVIKVDKPLVMDFPMVTICNANPFTTSFSNEYAKKLFGISNEIYLNMTQFNSMEDPYLTQSKYYLYLKSASFLISLNSASLNETEKKQLGSSLDEILISCSFSLNECNKTEDFDHIFDLILGNCFRFNSGFNMNKKPQVKLKQSIQNGLLTGLNIVLYLGQANENKNLFSDQHGYLILINHQGVHFPFSSGIFTSSGMATNIQLKREVTSYPPKPYSNCTDNLNSINSYDSELYKITMNSKMKYYEKDCQLLCYNKYLEETCNCTSPVFITYNQNMKICNAIEEVICQINFYDKFNNEIGFSICNCPQECETINYSYSSSTSDYPTKSYADSLMRNPLILKNFNTTKITFEEIQKSVVSVNIFYNENIETTVRAQIKTDLSSLISNIGGILGLFLGTSFLSFIEFAEIILQIIIISIKKGKNENKTFQK